MGLREGRARRGNAVLRLPGAGVARGRSGRAWAAAGAGAVASPAPRRGVPKNGERGQESENES